MNPPHYRFPSTMEGSRSTHKPRGTTLAGYDGISPHSGTTPAGHASPRKDAIASRPPFAPPSSRIGGAQDKVQTIVIGSSSEEEEMEMEMDEEEEEVKEEGKMKLCLQEAEQERRQWQKWRGQRFIS